MNLVNSSENRDENPFEKTIKKGKEESFYSHDKKIDELLFSE
jgi:hypothetical protein